ncbi:soluble lytic murein transglycosylase [Pseudorhodobacter antarcticus]|uniref:Soluble lytic murein transglycosylase n=1 Tax=Pseudorhodobacter antarcticus TaxID=1077947 RepID=A0A1H8AC18_9RHOB|nr:lytic transglycosylase domain-containing protein [Pseudorhodobacter antarcticus]SEM67358.1 soluble lytic murein transglycosylase [Pseudorhodobacter antarcticus]
MNTQNAPRRRFAVSFALLFALLLALVLAAPAHADGLRAALAASSARDWDKARSLAPRGVALDIVEWQRLRAGDGLLGDYEAFLTRRSDWPGMALLHQKGEVAVVRTSQPERVIAYFAKDRPSTAAGALALVQAHLALGQTEAAGKVARNAWGNLRFSSADQAQMIALQGAVLKEAHVARLDMLLWEGREDEAARMLSLVPAGWQALARARIALRNKADGVNALISAVPAAQAGDPGLAYERFLWRVRSDLQDGAIELLFERSASAASLGRPGEWADRRAGIARALVKAGRARDAYRVASQHHLTEGADYAELEFLAGFIALRQLKDGTTARAHFQHLKQGVSTPISLSRAHYWEGRAEEALGNFAAARAAFEAGAQHQTAYYGLLSAEKLGLPLDSALISTAQGGDWRGAAFATSTVFEAATQLLAAGDLDLAKRFLLHLAEGLDARSLRQLGDAALALGQPHIAVLIGKQAAGRGVILPRAYFPVVDMVPDGLAVSRALALSIARRESEFNPVVVSPAGARGLMQVMPGTAELMAAKLGKPYVLSDLTRDPAYNVVLGAGYLAQLVEEFGTSIALIASGYNAGPGRPRRWITEFGDPRVEGVDIVDWVETIPFSETRTYVMRVVESLVIYRAMLRGSVGVVNVSAELSGR